MAALPAPINSAPLVYGDTFQVAEDGILTGNVLANDLDPNHDPLTSHLVNAPLFGSVTIQSDGTFRYTPGENFYGGDYFTYSAQDSTGAMVKAGVLVDVTPVNDPPAAVEKEFTVFTGTANRLYVRSNDHDPECSPLTGVLVVEPAHGTVVIEEDGAFSYRPHRGYRGPDSFSYKVSDGALESDPAEIRLTVELGVGDLEEPIVGPDALGEPDDANPDPPDSETPVDSPAPAMLDPASMLAELAAAIASDSKSYTIPAGTYDFTGEVSQFKLEGIQNFTVNAENVLFIFAPRVRDRAIYLNACSNVTLRGLTIDYSPLPFAQGKITKINADGSFEVLLDIDSPELDATWIPDTSSTKLIPFGPDGQIRPHLLDFLASVSPLGDRLYLCTSRNSRLFESPGNAVQLGDSLAIADRQFRQTIDMNASQNCTLDSITLWAAPNMGFMERDCIGSTYRDCKIIRKPGTGRLLSANADGIFLIRPQGATIERAHIEYNGDDMVHAYAGLQFLVSDDTALVWRNNDLAAGEEVELYDGHGKLQGSTEIDWVKRISDPELISQAQKEAIEFGMLSSMAIRMKAVKIKLADPVTGPMAISKDTLLPQDISVVDSHFSNGHARGVVFVASGQIRSNVFEGMSASSIAVGADTKWGTGPVPHDVRIEGNRISDSNRLPHRMAQTTPIAIGNVFSNRLTGVLKGVVVSDNTISAFPPMLP